MNKEIKPVLDEISAILKKYDMTGIVAVANRTHCDYRMEIEASWSCARFEKDAGGNVLFRVRAKRADFPSAEAHHAALETTVGTFVTYSDILDCLNNNVQSVLVQLSKHVDFIGKSTREE